MQIDVWSDIACPWCWVGKRHLQAALEQLDGDFEVVWHSFELDRNAPAQVTGDYVQRLADKYGQTRDQAQGMIDQMTARGRGVGASFDFDRVQFGNTFLAHQVIQLAAGSGRQDAVVEGLFQAYFTDGASLSDIDTLVGVAVAAGLPEDEVRSALAEQTFAPVVRGDERTAQQIGVQGVPFFVLDRRFAVSGAQPVEVLVQALGQARDSMEPVPEGDACGVDGCA